MVEASISQGTMARKGKRAETGTPLPPAGEAGGTRLAPAFSRSGSVRLFDIGAGCRKEVKNW
ncbi:MAG: hypothetical protein BroJett024_01830 [Alphaproteobacteria bacterium]|nr:MAG: hypothetical protein BroJett024_01830 [Alphaproteobacteria bacterium]